MPSVVEANVDIEVEAVVELVEDSIAVVGGKADTDVVEPIMDSFVEITARHRGFSTGKEYTSIEDSEDSPLAKLAVEKRFFKQSIAHCILNSVFLTGFSIGNSAVDDIGGIS